MSHWLYSECIPIPDRIHDRIKGLKNLGELEEYLPGFKALIYATEQEISRPKDARKGNTHTLVGRRLIPLRPRYPSTLRA